MRRLGRKLITSEMARKNLITLLFILTANQSRTSHLFKQFIIQYLVEWHILNGVFLLQFEDIMGNFDASTLPQFTQLYC